MKKNQLIMGLLILAALVALVIWGRDRIHFDFGVFRSQLALADWRRIGLGFACIYLAYAFRSVRWAQLLKHNKKVPPFSLLGTQVIGFTAIALLGRVADPVRPYLVAKKTGLTLSSQLAVYIVERLFDAGSMALIFSSVILMPAWFGKRALCLTLKCEESRLSGADHSPLRARFFWLPCAWRAESSHHFLKEPSASSQSLGRRGEKIRAFRTGLNTLRTPADFAIAMAVSLSMWGLITMAYLEITTAFVANPQLAQMTPAKCMVLMASSIAVSGFQLPVLGWFTQIGAVAAALSGFFGVAAEPATACSATLLLVGFLGIAPIGLIWARFEHVSLRKIAAESEHAEEALAADEARD